MNRSDTVAEPQMSGTERSSPAGYSAMIRDLVKGAREDGRTCSCEEEAKARAASSEFMRGSEYTCKRAGSAFRP